MSQKIYLIWYRSESDLEDKIRGAALNWKRAEEMALSLELHLSSMGKTVEVGVKTYLHGEIFLDPDKYENRWTKEEFEVPSERR